MVVWTSCRGSADALEAELTKAQSVDRQFPGFEDFAVEGHQGITPRQPARSIFYHALASPNVLWKDSNKTQGLDRFPDLQEIEVVENYVFGMTPPSLSFLTSLFSGREIGIVVFAYQYRTAIDVPHQRHADLVFSRTGIARVISLHCR